MYANSLDFFRRTSYMTSVIILTGCSANYSSIFRSNEITGKELYITQDAKQTTSIYKARLEADDRKGGIVTCVGPSPDALSVTAASLSGSADAVGKFGAALAGSRDESGGSIGLRTQSITLLRDQAFRICEAYANGVISAGSYASLLRRNQFLVTTALAIEQLTGATKADNITVQAQSSPSKPDTSKPDTPKPDTSKPDTPKPDTPKPDTPGARSEKEMFTPATLTPASNPTKSQPTTKVEISNGVATAVAHILDQVYGRTYMFDTCLSYVEGSMDDPTGLLKKSCTIIIDAMAKNVERNPNQISTTFTTEIKFK